jgi:hypothetical protein
MSNIPSGKELAEALTLFVNTFSAREKNLEFVKTLTREHRTLQQSVGRLIMGLIKEWSEMYERHEYDGRNEAICKLSYQIRCKFEDDMYLPFI